jgi:UDP-N-acetylglucosamine--N-acetylmuramyl-(pentapeptide) pyrophosphoryl-undecaprenol N-acetylglucosamine transferase
MILRSHAEPAHSGIAEDERGDEPRLRTARILFCGGGTGGHLMPAITLARAAEERWPGLETRFLVAGRSAEEPFFRERRSSAIPLFAGSASRPALWRLDRYVAACWRARHEVIDWHADLVVLLGGYVSLAALAAGRVPMLLLESNVRPGKTARLLARRSTAVLLEWPEAAATLGGARCVASGVPQPDELFDRDRRTDRVALGLSLSTPVLLMFGGSQGAHGLNQLARQLLPALARQLPALQVILVAGREAESLKGLALPANVSLRVESFLWPMAPYYGAADLVIARAGGMTVAELCAVGRAGILIPYPHHRDQHQRHNALCLANAGAAILMDEGPWAADELANHAGPLLRAPDKCEAMASRARALGKPRCLGDALDLIEQLVLRSPLRGTRT